jgi:hypothetical protein
VPDDFRDFLLRRLGEIRKLHDYQGEIHFNQIKGASRQNKAFQVARGWLECYFREALGRCPFKAFAVDQNGPRPFPYPGADRYATHAARSLQTAFLAGIAWSYGNFDKVILQPVFDASDSELDLTIAQSFPSRLQSAVSDKCVLEGKNYPMVEVHSVKFVDSNPMASEVDWADSELIQLCDLLLGAAFDALKFRGKTRNTKTGRLRLAKSVGQVLKETLVTPWFQQIRVHRRFSVSLYPDKFNMSYPAALKLIERPERITNQPSFFGD